MIRRLATTTVYRGLIGVRVDRVRLPDGTDTDHTVLEYPSAVAVVAMTSRRQLILTRQYRYVLQDWSYELPGGIVENGEAPTAAALRELEEETGYRANQLDPLLAIHPDTCLSTQMIQIYLARDLRLTEQSLEHTEILEKTELPVADAVAMVIAGKISDAASVVGLLAVAGFGIEEQ